MSIHPKEKCYKCGNTLNENLQPSDCSICNPNTDMVNSPPHYNKVIECIDAMKAMSDDAELPSSHAHYCWQTIFKYIWRHPYKGKPVEDLRKAEYYLKRLINEYDENIK